MPDIAQILAEQNSAGGKVPPPTPLTPPTPAGDNKAAPAPPGPKPAAPFTPQPPLFSPLPTKPVEDPPAHLAPPPEFDIGFERSKDRLRHDLETIDKHSPFSRIVPAKYPFFVPYVARTVVQNALDRNMQLNEERHVTYLREVDEVIMMMYPLLVPALIAVQEAVERARQTSRVGLGDARPEERTLAFEQAILSESEKLKALDFPHTALTEPGVEGINICKSFVAECFSKLVRRIEFRKKRNAGLLALVNMSAAATAEVQEDKAASDAGLLLEKTATQGTTQPQGITV